MKISVLAERIGNIAEWILFGFLLVLASYVLLFSPNFLLFLALLCMSLLVLPKKWTKWEFYWRFSFFLLIGFFFEFLFVLFAQEPSDYIYFIVMAVPMAISLLLLVNKYKWIISSLVNTESILFAAIFLAAVMLLYVSGLGELKNSLFVSSTFLAVSYTHLTLPTN